MSTVSNVPVPPKTITPKSNVTSGQGPEYGRPTSGGAPVAGKPEGNAPAPIPSGVVPGADAYHPNLAGNVSANPTINGADIVAPVAQPDATGHPANSAGSKGTVGESGPGLGQ